MRTEGWIGVDLDGTLAMYRRVEEWDGSIGEPVVAMAARVKRWLDDGRDVRIVTARVAPVEGITDGPRAVDVQRELIEAWCEKHLGVVLPITAAKDYHMLELWDDRAVQVIQNTGRTLADFVGEIADQAVAMASVVPGVDA